MRCGRFVGLRQLLTERNDDVLRHALVEGNHIVTHLAIGPCVVKDADDGGVAAFEDAGDAAQAAAVSARRSQFHQHLVALHGAVDLVGRDENVIFSLRTPGVCSGARSRSRRDADRGGRR